VDKDEMNGFSGAQDFEVLPEVNLKGYKRKNCIAELIR